MELIYKVTKKSNEKGSYKSHALYVQRSDGSRYLITYDRNIIANVLDVATCRLSEYNEGEYSLGKE